MITSSIEIARRPEEVFGYLDQLDRHDEWQEQIMESRVETEGPTRVGSRAVDKRNVPGGPRDVTYEITEHDPPRSASFKGLDGPVRPVGKISVEPLDDGSRSRSVSPFHPSQTRTTRHARTCSGINRWCSVPATD